jgi:hypothetical protein
VLRPNVKARNNEVRKRKMTLRFYSWTPLLLQGSTSLAVSSANCRIRAEACWLGGIAYLSNFRSPLRPTMG